MKVAHSIQVQYQSTDDPSVAREWLASLPDLFACDFETAIRYTDEEVENAKKALTDMSLPKKTRVGFQSIARASALGHPSHCTITHCSIAYSSQESYVFIISSQEMADVILDFLVETEKTQVWHNYCYDGKFIRYFTYKDAKNIEDTQILAKTLLNHVEVFKANTGLKELMGAYYGEWGISADNFHVSQQYEPEVLQYAATDACATYYLWEHLNDFIKNQSAP